MKKMKQTATKLIASILAILILVSTIPLSTFAAEMQSDTMQQSVENQNENSVEPTEDILYEMKEKRDINTKVYKKSDGTYTAMIASEPLHYMQDGEWVDIDNSLVETTRDGYSAFTNTDNPLDVSLPQVLSQEHGVTLSNGAYTLQFALTDAAQSEAELSQPALPAETDKLNAATADGTPLKTVSETAVYADVLPHTDLEYSISSQTVKENIVIQKKSAVRDTYTFSVAADNLSAVKNTDGSVSFLESTGSEVFKIPAPFMQDAKGIVSTDIPVSLQEVSLGSYLVTYTPSKAWLQDRDREYPVIIDPIIALREEDWFTACTVKSSEPNANYHDSSLDIALNGITVDQNTGEYTDSGEYLETYIQLYPEMVSILSEGITPIDVELVLTGIANNIAAYEITEPFDPSTVTYQTKPKYNDAAVDYYTGILDGAERLVHFNITKLFTQWLSGEKANNGIALYSYDHTMPGGGFFRTHKTGNGGTFLYIDFVESSGYSNRFAYHSQDIGRAGTSYVNDFLQRLMIQRNDISISGNIMPVNVSAVYNPSLYVKVDKYLRLLGCVGEVAPQIPAAYGNGWLTSYNRCLYANDFLWNGNGNLCYADENGNVLYFNAVRQEDGTISYEEENADIFGESGYQITGYEDIPANCETAGYEYLKLKTPRGETEQFDQYGRLIRIYKEKYPEQSIDIAYRSELLDESTGVYNFFAIKHITDGAGRMYAFNYNENEQLVRIQCYTALSNGTSVKAGGTASDLKTLYDYDENGNLTKVTFPDGGTATYEYNAENRLTAAISRGMYKLTYTYDNFGRVRGIAEYAQDLSTNSGYTLGNTITVTPSGPKQVSFRDASGVEETVQFDKYGRSALVTDARGNYTDLESGAQGTVGINMLANPSFENGWENWERSTSAGFSVTDTVSYAGGHAVKCEAATASSNTFTQSKAHYIPGTYTLSAYIRAENGFTGTEKLQMQLCALDRAGEVIEGSLRTVAATSAEFTRYSVSLNVPNGVAALKVSIGFAESSGTFYVDGLQLEKGSGSGAYNLLDDHTFDMSHANPNAGIWTGDNVNFRSAQTVNAHTCCTPWFAASKNAAYTLSQTVPLQGQAGDVVSFSGWMKADVVSNSADCRLAEMFPDTTNFLGDRFAGITLTYTYTATQDGGTVTKTETVRRPIRDFISDWQFVSDYVVLKGDCTEVTFAFEYTKHPATAYVAMPCVSFEKAPAFAAEEVLPPDVPEENTETPTPELCVCGANCAYGDGCPCTCASAAECTCVECKGCVCEHCTRLDCTCRCESEETCTCPQCKKLFDIQYDEYGNLTSLTVSGYNIDTKTLLSMFTVRTFSAGGNYMTSATDENGNTVLYNYDTSNGMLSKLTDARGNATEYTYNAMGALAEVRTPVSGLATEALGLIKPKEMKTNYIYLNDQVVTIRHNDFSYYIDYDRWNNVDRLYANTVAAAAGAVLDSAVADYTYGTGVNHSRLESVRYGNGGTVHYRYDENNRVVGVSYDGGNTDRFRYGYDALGNVVYVYDGETQRMAFYNENSVEVYTNDGLLYFVGVDSEGNTVECVDNKYTYITKSPESTRDTETGVTSQKTEITANNYTFSALKSTDVFGRLLQKSIISDLAQSETAEASNFAAVVSDYTYQTDENGTAKSRISSLQNRVTYGTAMTAENTLKTYGFAYEYDANGNITAEYDAANNNALRYRYRYDEANQLVRVDDNVRGNTTTYQYDKGGNRVSEKIYNYTLSDSLGTPIKEVQSAYNYLTWKDRLSSYDGKTITYDAAGNPTKYGNKTYTWEGKFLTEVADADGSKTQFEYDANGFRTQKRQYGTDGRLEYYVEYLWLDGKLTQQALTLMAYRSDGTSYGIGPISAKFVYEDNSQQPQSCLIGDTVLLFVRNLQGDVVAVVNGDGSIWAEFTYDAWGNVEVTSPLEDESIREAALKMLPLLCPLTYRGYNYDFTTGLYYLQSRYYNPEWGRFLNCDDTSILLATQGETHGANLFAYCNNNPVNYADYTGKLPEIIVRIYSYINFLTNVQYQFTDYVFGQSVGPVSNMRYGFHSMSYNGCEVIAVYNALKFLGKFTYIYNIIHDFELYGYIWADGLFGTYPSVLGDYMRAKGFSVKTFYFTKTMDQYVRYNRCFIVVYAHSKGIHAVMVRGASDGKRIVVYNRYNSCTTTRIVSSISQLVKEDGFKMIVGYWIY